MDALIRDGIQGRASCGEGLCAWTRLPTYEGLCV